MRTTLIAAAVALSIASPAAAQLGGLGKIVDNASKAKKTFDDLNFTEDEERQLGDDISVQLRNKYGVVQDPAVHKYVTLAGKLLANESTRPNLKWTFIVLDTDGVNAFAAPGGFIHITKGALALIKNESELADVLAHEIAHVTEKHTIHYIQQGKLEGLGADATRQQVIAKAAQKGFDMVFNGQFSQGDEESADKVGIALANKVGYAPAGLSVFLKRVMDRNKDLKERSGFFASHPAMQARVDGVLKQMAAARLTATATGQARYAQNIKFESMPVDKIPQAAAAEPAKPASSGGGKMGLGNVSNALGNQSSSSQTISSAGSRGLNPDRDAKGGPNKGIVIVTVTPAEVDAFRKGIAG
jgi:predicted Zn-dependent protease